jgi:putative sigma-54 modulation protein
LPKIQCPSKRPAVYCDERAFSKKIIVECGEALMKLSINFRNMRGSGNIITYIDHRLSFAFAGTRHEIERTTITVSDVNGPKGVIDKQCKVVIKPAGLREIVIAETRENIRQAIDLCLARASRSLNRKLKRRHALTKKVPDSQRMLLEASPEA